MIKGADYESIWYPTLTVIPRANAENKSDSYGIIRNDARIEHRETSCNFFFMFGIMLNYVNSKYRGITQYGGG
jgi:hypothetical protein